MRGGFDRKIITSYYDALALTEYAEGRGGRGWHFVKHGNFKQEKILERCSGPTSWPPHTLLLLASRQAHHAFSRMFKMAVILLFLMFFI